MLVKEVRKVDARSDCYVDVIVGYYLNPKVQVLDQDVPLFSD